MFPSFCLRRTMDAANKLILTNGTPAESHLPPWSIAPRRCCSCRRKTSSFKLRVPTARPGMASLLINTTKQSFGLLLGTERGVTFSLRHFATSWIVDGEQLAFPILSHESIFTSFFGLLALLVQLFQTGHHIKSRKIPPYHHCLHKQRLHLAGFPIQLMNSPRIGLRAVILPNHAVLLRVLPIIFLPTVEVSVQAWIISFLRDTIYLKTPTIKSPDTTSSQVTRLDNSVPAPLRSCSLRGRLPWSHHIGDFHVLAGFSFLVLFRESHHVTANLAGTGCCLIIAYYIGVRMLFRTNHLRTQITCNTDTCHAHLLQSSSPNRNHSNNVRGKRSYSQSSSGDFSYGNDGATDMETDETNVDEDMETGESAHKVMEIESDASVSMEIDKVEVNILEVDYDDCDDAGIAMETDDKDDTDMGVDLHEEEKMEWEELLTVRRGFDFTRFHYGSDHVFITQPLHKTSGCAGLKTETMEWEENVSTAGWKWLRVSFSASENSAPASTESPVRAFLAQLPPPPLLSLRRIGTVPHHPSQTATIIFESFTNAGDARQLDQLSLPRGPGPEGTSAIRDNRYASKGPRNRRTRSLKRASFNIMGATTQFKPRHTGFRHSIHNRGQVVRCGQIVRRAIRANQPGQASSGVRLATRFQIRQGHETTSLVRAFTELRLKECDMKLFNGQLSS
ncbi:uncharacterized protein LOC110982161 isoform X2 [Acanthaster planci]|uniref:Uncharacterized protein LOC110982161 isoform X2 n=1 Tax=Acanthaster planci TaxID=133434 RepID=A0A8B7YS33_ACAPL|nr:uncharacterized protein LOC110982161 isoform X2 [Acanthaster planci]